MRLLDVRTTRTPHRTRMTPSEKLRQRAERRRRDGWRIQDRGAGASVSLSVRSVVLNVVSEAPRELVLGAR